MGIEGIENLTGAEEAEIQSPDTEITHAADVNTENPDGETVEVTEEAVADEPQAIEVTENPGDKPEEAEQTDDGSTDNTESDPASNDEPLPANPNVVDDTPNA